MTELQHIIYDEVGPICFAPFSLKPFCAEPCAYQWTWNNERTRVTFFLCVAHCASYRALVDGWENHMPYEVSSL